jgi:formate dehydrogenase alpha subunit
MTNAIDEIKDADTILIIGSNTTEQHPLIAMRVMDAKLRHGAKLFVVDPRRIPLADLADEYAPIAPGTNLAFINGLLHIIIFENKINETFIKERTEGYEELKASLEKYTPSYVSNITGINEDMLRKIAYAYADAKNASILYAMGITQHVTGSKSVAALANLTMITGQIGRYATGINPLRGQNNVQGSCDMGALPSYLSGYQNPLNEDIRAKFSKVWGSFTSEIGQTVPQMLDNASHGKLKGLFVLGENPVLSDPDMEHVKHSLSELDLLVVQDIFMTETAELAHVVLPGASFLEKDGTFTNTERRVQRVRQVLPPIGNSQADWKIILELYAKMGYPQSFNSPADIMAEISTLVPSYGGITYDRIDQNGLQWPCPHLDHPGTSYLHKDKFTRGLGKLTVNEYEGGEEKASTDFPYILTTGRVSHQYHTGTMTRRAWALEREYPQSFIEINPVDAAAIGVKSDWNVKVSSPRGEIITVAKVTDRVKPGVTFMPFHYVESPVNKLTNRNLDPVSEIPEYKVCAVRIEEY